MTRQTGQGAGSAFTKGLEKDEGFDTVVVVVVEELKRKARVLKKEVAWKRLETRAVVYV